MILAMLGAILLWWERRLSVWHAPSGCVCGGFSSDHGCAGLFDFFNFGFWHFPTSCTAGHVHYYIGSKYFKELHYERLYECVATADSEEPGLRRGSSCAR